MVKQMLQKGVYNLASFTSLHSLKMLTSRKIILPFYHSISDQYQPHIGNLYQSKNRKEFLKDIDYLCLNFDPIDLNTFNQISHNQKSIKRPVFHLSFDDGLSDNYLVAKDILTKKGIPATFFVNSSFVDNKELFYRYKVSLIIEHLKNRSENFLFLENIFAERIRNFQDAKKKLLKIEYKDIKLLETIQHHYELDISEFLKEKKPYLISAEIKEMIELGFSIGSHSKDHPHFSDLTFEEQKLQYIESFDFLENHFSIKERYFSFPFGSEKINKELFDWFTSNGNITASFGVSGMKDDIIENHFHRIPMEYQKYSAEQILKKEYLYYILKSPLGKNLLKR